MNSSFKLLDPHGFGTTLHPLGGRVRLSLARHDAWGSGEGPREDLGPGFKRAPGLGSTRRCGGHTLHQRWWSIIFPGHATFHTWVSHLAVAVREVRCGGQHSLEVLQYRRRAVRLRTAACPLFHPQMVVCVSSPCRAPQPHLPVPVSLQEVLLHHLAA